MGSVLLALFAAVVAALVVLCSSSVARLSGFFLVLYPSPRRVADPTSYCRTDCATPSNDKANHVGGYLAWILSEEENNDVMSLIYEQAVSVVPVAGYLVLGGSRKSSGTTFYWNEYPAQVLGNNPLGIAFYEGVNRSTGTGTTHPINGMYNFFLAGQPDNDAKNENILCFIRDPNAWGWNDMRIVSVRGVTSSATLTAMTVIGRLSRFSSSTRSVLTHVLTSTVTQTRSPSVAGSNTLYTASQHATLSPSTTQWSCTAAVADFLSDFFRKSRTTVGRVSVACQAVTMFVWWRVW
jgi:hypothetical protein